MSLRKKLIRMAHANPELRPHLMPLLKQADESLLALEPPVDVADYYASAPSTAKRKITLAVEKRDQAAGRWKKALPRYTRAMQEMDKQHHLFVQAVEDMDKVAKRGDLFVYDTFPYTTAGSDVESEWGDLQRAQDALREARGPVVQAKRQYDAQNGFLASKVY